MNVGDKFYEFTGWTDANTTTPTKEYKIASGSTGQKDLVANWREVPAAELGSLTVSMLVTGAASNTDRSKEFNFTLVLDTPINGTFGDFSFTNGTANFKLKSGDDMTASGLPAGITYTVAETEANKDGFVTTGYVGSNVSDTGSVSGTIAAGANAVQFENHKYTPAQLTVSAVKTLNGRAPGNYQFYFLLQQGDTIIDRRLNDSNGNVAFTLTFDRPGTYTYTVKEYNDGRAGIRWDTHTYTVTVTVAPLATDTNPNGLALTVVYTRDGNPYYSSNNALQFTNYTTLPPGYVRTGDDANPALWIAAMALSVVAIAGIVIVNRRKKKDNQG